MSKAYQIVRLWAETVATLRLISALTGEKIVAIVDRLASAELAKLEGQDEA